MKIGDVQKSVLYSLKLRGSWHPCCGWIWGNYSCTKRILDSLVKKGLASFDGNKYKITKDGVVAISANRSRNKNDPIPNSKAPRLQITGRNIARNEPEPANIDKLVSSQARVV